MLVIIGDSSFDVEKDEEETEKDKRKKKTEEKPTIPLDKRRLFEARTLPFKKSRK